MRILQNTHLTFVVWKPSKMCVFLRRNEARGLLDFYNKSSGLFSSQFYRKSKLRSKFKRSAFNSLFKMKEEKVEVDETFSIKFEDPIPAKRIKQEPKEPLEERKAVVHPPVLHAVA